MAVTAQRRTHRLAAGGHRVRRAALQLLQVRRKLAPAGLRQHGGRDLADALQLGQRARLGPRPQLPGRKSDGDRGRGPERPDAVGRLVRAFEKEGDAAQRLDRVHATIVAHAGG